MTAVSRRAFLRWAGIGASGLLISERSWPLDKLAPASDPLAAHPYRSWEDIYRNEWQWDRVGISAHCSNCAGNCAWRVYVKDGIVMREEQLAEYPRVNERLPDFNPRGCQKGAVHSSAMYDGDRLRFPLKRVGARGQGKWQRISWEQALREIAAKALDLYAAHGPGALLATAGSGIQADIRQAATLRFAALTGDVHRDITTCTGDVPTGMRLAYGRSWQISGTTDRLFDADYMLLAGCNPNVTRMPDAHFIWEAKYNGCRIVIVTPDYNPSAIHADLWLPIRQGSDPFFMMSLAHVIIEEGLVNEAFVREQTDLPLLVRLDNGRLLRERDLDRSGRDDVFYLWDRNSGRAVAAPGSTGSPVRSIALEGIEPALEGRYEVAGIAVRPAFEAVREEAAKFPPEKTAKHTGIHPEVVRAEARSIAAARMAVIVGGFSLPKYTNGILTLWSQALIMALTGHGGPTGEIQYMGVHWQRPALAALCFPKPIRIETGMGEWLEGEQHREAQRHYRQDELRRRIGYDVAELQAMIGECLEKKWMPHWGRPRGMIVWADNLFRRNKSVDRYRERLLAQTADLYVNVNYRMDSSARWADYVLPAASHYEAWETRQFPFHRYLSVSSAPAAPLGEAKPDWDIVALLCREIQEQARRRRLPPMADPAFDTTRDLTRLYDDFTMNGRLRTAYDATRWLIEHSPELGGVSIEEAAARGFVVMNDKAIGPNHSQGEDRVPIAWGPQVVEKKPYPTLSGRITFYIDHEWFLRLGVPVPTARHPAGRDCSRYPLGLYSPHTRWGIHSNWRSNKYMTRLQRGEPHVYINPRLARARGIRDGDRVRVFNDLGEFFAMAKLYPSGAEDCLMIEHAWEPYQFRDGKCINSVSAPMLQPLEMVGNWGHLRFEYFDFNPNQMAHASGVDIEKVDPA